MPFPIGHGLVGASLFAATQREIDFKRHWKFLLLSAGLAILPDADFAFDWFFHLRGWHRGFTHSIAFGVFTGLAAGALVGIRDVRRTSGFVLAAISHGFFDTLVTSSDGSGVELLWPLSDHRYKLGWLEYFSFNLHPGSDPWSEILRLLLTVSFLEVLMFGPIFVVIVLLNKKAD